MRSMMAVLAIAIFAILIITSPVIGQGGGQLSPEKQAFLAREQALQTEAARMPHAPKATDAVVAASCPDRFFQPGGIFKFRIGPFPRGNLFNTVAGNIVNGMEYTIYAGALKNPFITSSDFPPPLFGEPAPVYTGQPEDMTRVGLLRVIRNPVDPCAAALLGIEGSMQDYLYPRGVLTITQIGVDTVDVNIAGGGTDRFNFVTGQYSQSQPAATVIPAPPTKLTAEAIIAAKETQVASVPRSPKPTPLPVLTSCPNTPTDATGIFDARPGPFTRGDLIVNVASVYWNGTQYRVYAGAPGNNPTAGLLRVIQLSNNPCAAAAAQTSSYTLRDYVVVNGPLMVTQVDQDVVSYVRGGLGGVPSRFNFVTGQFYQPELIITVAAPPPSPTPGIPIVATPTRSPYP